MTHLTSIRILLGILIGVILFHFSIIAKVVPYDITWGGQLKNDSEMYLFETLSILINLFLGMVLLMKANYLKFRFSEKTIHTVLWIFLVLFTLNTVGNLFAKTLFEQSLAVLTLTLAILIGITLKTKTISPK